MFVPVGKIIKVRPRKIWHEGQREEQETDIYKLGNGRTVMSGISVPEVCISCESDATHYELY